MIWGLEFRRVPSRSRRLVPPQGTRRAGTNRGGARSEPPASRPRAGTSDRPLTPCLGAVRGGPPLHDAFDRSSLRRPRDHVLHLRAPGLCPHRDASPPRAALGSGPCLGAAVPAARRPRNECTRPVRQGWGGGPGPRPRPGLAPDGPPLLLRRARPVPPHLAPPAAPGDDAL